MHRRRENCRACDSRSLEAFLELGPTPLANAFLRAPADFEGEPSFPLGVNRCTECSLVQLVDVIDPEVLFRDYIYVTGTSDTMRAHFDAYAQAVVDAAGLGAEDLVVEVASNDGSLLGSFAARGVRTLGVEPALNIAKIARDKGIETLAEFFDADLARRLAKERGPAAAVVANNVLAHVDDPRDFLEGAAALVGDTGRVVFEVPYLREFIDRVEYDTVYHEHLCYFSVLALMRLCEGAGLRIARVDRVPVHGGSLRVTCEGVTKRAAHSAEAEAVAEEERAAGLDGPAVFEEFANRVRRSRELLLAMLRELRESGARVAAYGAPAKGNTLLNYCGIGPDLVEYVADRSPHKVGRYTPGSHLEVKPVEVLLEDRPDYVLILAWNLAEEIMQQQRAWAEGGGRFILPLPEPRVVTP
jgi:SAM-dependent methyltransferase